MVSVSMANRALWSTVAAGQYDDGLTSLYDIGLDTTPGHIQYNGIGRVGVRFDAGAGGLNAAVKSVWVRFRKYGNPTGNVTVGIRKASDDSLVTIGTWPIDQLGPAGTEQSFIVRLRSNTYQMLINDVVSVEFPSSATDGLELILIVCELSCIKCTMLTSKAFNRIISLAISFVKK